MTKQQQRPVTESALASTAKAGDRWWQSDDCVLINEVVVTDDAVKVSGYIVKGWGASKKLRHWSFILDQMLELERGRA